MNLVKRISLAGSACVLLAVVVVGIVATELSVASLDRHAQEALTVAGNGAAARIGDWVAANARVVESIADETVDSPESLKDFSGATDTRLLHALDTARKASGFRLAFVGIAGDHRYLRKPPGPMPTGYDPTVRPWYRQAAEASRLVIPAPYIDATEHDLILTFAMPVKRDGKLFGVLGGVNSLASVRRIVEQTQPTPHSYAVVIDSDGRIVVHPDASQSLHLAADVLPWFRPELASDSVIEITDRDRTGWARMVDIPNTHWRMALVLDRADVLADVPQLVGSVALAGLAVALAVALTLTVFTRRSLAPLSAVADAMADIAQGRGDLDAHIAIGGKDEVGRVAGSFNAFVQRLRELVSDVQSASAEVELAAREIASGNQDLSNRTERQAGMVQSCAQQLTRVSAAADDSVEHAGGATSIARNAAELASSVGDKTTSLQETMEEIRGSSKQISEIVAVIDGIAIQTNILSLNAAAEAARAGVEGRGFGAVAEEIRALAGRSAEAARDIRAVIQRSSSRVEMGAQRLNDTSAAIDTVVQSILKLSVLMDNILSSSQTQREDIAGVSDRFVQLDDIASQNAALVEQAAAAAQSLSAQAGRLMHVVALFRS